MSNWLATDESDSIFTRYSTSIYLVRTPDIRKISVNSISSINKDSMGAMPPNLLNRSALSQHLRSMLQRLLASFCRIPEVRVATLIDDLGSEHIRVSGKNETDVSLKNLSDVLRVARVAAWPVARPTSTGITN